MKILVVSKCPTHPTTAGNRWGILAQTKILEKLDNEIHFLYIQELPMKIDKKPFSYDKITMVHPHSMAGVFQKDKAPIYAFTTAEEWVSFLDKVWANQDEIVHVKSRNKSYIEKMNGFFLCEYKRFFNY